MYILGSAVLSLLKSRVSLSSSPSLLSYFSHHPCPHISGHCVEHSGQSHEAGECGGVSPNKAPWEMTFPAQPTPVCTIAVTRGASDAAMLTWGTIPVATMLIAMYMEPAIVRDPMIPREMFLCGFLVSSARELTISKPR